MVGKLEGKRPLGMCQCRWEDNINDFKGTCWEDVEWIHLAQNSKKWRALVYTVMDPWVT
jgi:hypothetical protein